MNLFLSCAFLIVSLSSAPPQDVKPVSDTALVERAEAGDAQAQFELGRAYEDGKTLPQDDARAVEWFRKSADQGSAQAQNSLGVMYALGRGVPRDREEAVRWYKKAAKQGLSEAIYNVATSYYNGEGIEENPSLAYAWMTVAQRKGDAQAAEAMKHIADQLDKRLERSQFDLAVLYEKGDEIPRDLPAAAALYLEIAGHKSDLSYAGDARFKLCQLYVAGKGVPQDYGQAISWCKKSGVPFADVVLGRLAEKGLGGDKNPREALDYYQKAAVLNVPDGYMEAARLELESGSHDGQKKAYFWLATAAKFNFAGAQEKLHSVAANLSAKEMAEQEKEAATWRKMRIDDRLKYLKKH